MPQNATHKAAESEQIAASERLSDASNERESVTESVRAREREGVRACVSPYVCVCVCVPCKTVLSACYGLGSGLAPLGVAIDAQAEPTMMASLSVLWLDANFFFLFFMSTHTGTSDKCERAVAAKLEYSLHM